MFQTRLEILGIAAVVIAFLNILLSTSYVQNPCCRLQVRWCCSEGIFSRVPGDGNRRILLLPRRADGGLLQHILVRNVHHFWTVFFRFDLRALMGFSGRETTAVSGLVLGSISHFQHLFPVSILLLAVYDLRILLMLLYGCVVVIPYFRTVFLGERGKHMIEYTSHK